jgi:hypothetical protein
MSLHEPAPASLARAGHWATRRRAAGPDPVVFQLGPCPRLGLQSLDGGPIAQTRPRSPAGLKPKRRLASAKWAARRRGRPTPPARAFASARSLRQGRPGDTLEAIAPDAATLRSRHVARRMDCSSSCELLRITVVAVVEVGRAVSRCSMFEATARVKLPTVVSIHLRDASPQLRHEIWSRSARAALPPKCKQIY